MKRVMVATLVLGLTTMLGAVRADGPTKNDKKAEPSKPVMKHVFLGVAIEPMPAALADKMSAVVPKGQGVLVEHVAKDSPAAHAGLRAKDILMSYGDQKLNTPDQVVKLVRADKIGHEVAVGYVRDGKLETCKVKLGERAAPRPPDMSTILPFLPEEQLREFFARTEAMKGNQGWESFDALKMTRVNDKSWHVEIDYRSKDGKKEHKVFDGTREQLHKDIRAEKDLPAAEQNHLLRALDLREPTLDFPFPSFEHLGQDSGKKL